MTTEISELLAVAATRTVPVVRAIGDDQLDAPTPCDEFRVRDLVNHLFQVMVNFQALADRKPVDFSTTPDEVTGDWRERFATETDRLVAAWSDPATLTGVSPGMGLPQPIVAQMALFDLTIHGWDLARATGREYAADPQVITVLHALAEMMGPQARENGVFAAVVEVPADADPLTRLLALTGRG